MEGQLRSLLRVRNSLLFELRQINPDFQYSHDGILSLLGHRHDWEGITVVWQRDEAGDWWHRAVSKITNVSRAV